MNTSKDKPRRWLPELNRFATEKDAKEATRAWSKQQLKTVSFWFGLVGYTVLTGLVVSVVLILIRQWIPLPPALFGGIVGGVVGGTGFAALTWYWRHRHRRFLRERLNALGIPICHKCGYNLTGNQSGVCPECGTKIAP